MTIYLFVYLSDEAAADENVTIAFRTLKALVTQKHFNAHYCDENILR